MKSIFKNISFIKNTPFISACIVIFILSVQNFYAQPLFTDIKANLTGELFGSVAWGDYNNDGYLDFIIVGGGLTKIYRNNGDSTFTEQTGISLPGVKNGSVAWGDYDNDGDLDILITGQLPSNALIAKVYKNIGNNFFTEQTGIKLPGVQYGSASWGDYNNDGRLDILLTGEEQNFYNVTAIYKNNGDNTFTEQTGIKLAQVSYSSIAWGDYDKDGDLDIMLTGQKESVGSVGELYRNNSNNTFTDMSWIFFANINQGTAAWGDYNNDGHLDLLETGSGFSLVYKNNTSDLYDPQSSVSLVGIDNGASAWGDYNNDGNLDILLSGHTGSGAFTAVYENNNDNTFTNKTDTLLTGLMYSAVAWGDFDNDHDLDILVNGYSSQGTVCKIYRNNSQTPNMLPDAPTGLTSTVTDTSVILRWNPVKTDATPAAGMSYNIRIGQTSKGIDVVSPESDTNGFRLIPAMGNAQLDTFFILLHANKGTYYWSVQAIDNAWNGGPFSKEQTFNFSADIQASDLWFSSVNRASLDLFWNRGNGSKCIVIAHVGGPDKQMPYDKTTYNADSAFGQGSEIGSSGWFCVYNGTGNTVRIMNLSPDTVYTFQVIEYTGSQGNERYYTTKGSQNPIATGYFVTGMNNDKVVSLTIKPNPVDDVLHIGPMVASCHAKIYTVEGQLVLTSNLTAGINEIPVSTLKPGIYMIIVKTPHTELHGRFVKK